MSTHSNHRKKIAMSDDKTVHIYLDDYGRGGDIVSISTGNEREASAYAFNRRPDLDALLHLSYPLATVIDRCGSLNKLDKEHLSSFKAEDGITDEFITRH